MASRAPTQDELRRAAAGDVRARDALFDTFLPVVLRWCIRLGGPRVAPEDAAHDVFIVVLRKLDSLENPERFTSWLFGITRRVLRKHRGRAWVMRWTGGDIVDSSDPRQDPARDLESSETTRKVQRALAELPEKQREVLVLCDLEERTAPEVAELLGIPLGTVASRLRLAREKFERVARVHDLHSDLATGGTS